MVGAICAGTGRGEIEPRRDDHITMAITALQKQIVFLSSVVLLFVGFSGTSAQVSSQSVPRMTIAELKTQLENPDFTIIDVRSSADWQGSTMKIKGAIREESQQVDAWISKYPKDKNIVLY